MNKFLQLAIFCPALISAEALADPFQLEGNLAYLRSDENDSETKVWSATATWWFEPVNTAGLPWKEAGFVSRSSSISVGFDRTRIEQTLSSPLPVSPPVVVDTRNDTEQLFVAGRYVLPAKRWFVDGTIARVQTDSSTPGATEPAGEQYSFGAGYYLTPRTTLRLHASRGDLDGRDRINNDCAAALRVPLFACVDSVTIQQETRTTEYALSFRHLGSIASFTYAIEVTAGSRKVKSESEVSLVLVPGRLVGPIEVNPVTLRDSSTLGPLEFTTLSAHWYPVDRVGVGISVSYTDRDAPFGDGHLLAYGLDAEWFIAPQLAVSGQWRRERAPVSTLGDVDAFKIGLSYRW